MGYGYLDINAAIKNLKLVKRRQELKGNLTERLFLMILLITQQLLKRHWPECKQGSLIKKLSLSLSPLLALQEVIYFKIVFPGSFEFASYVIILKPVRKTTALSAEDLDLELLKRDLLTLGKQVSIVENLNELTDQMNRSINSDCLVVTLSNGKVFGLYGANLVQDV